MLWDEQYLYVAAELAEPHVWATLTAHDSVIFKDPDFEVFIDPDGDTHQYYEFEINALNAGWDLLLEKPYMDGGPPRNEWEIPGLKTAVRIQGTLNQANDVDHGWTVEIAFPWKVLSAHARHPGAPNAGEQWRINFSRVEWRVTNDDKTYQKVPDTPEDNWVWSPQGVVDMHRPEMWGLVQFLPEAAGKKPVVVASLPGKEARDVSLEIYYAQLDFFKAHNRWAASLAELPWASTDLPVNQEAPLLRSTPEGYECVVGFSSDRRHRRANSRGNAGIARSLYRSRCYRAAVWRRFPCRGSGNCGRWTTMHCAGSRWCLR